MATPIPKKSFQLVNTEGQAALDIQLGDSYNGSYRYTDLDLDGNGGIRMIKEQEATVQSTLKCIFTEKQNSGYGSNIYSFIGEKDVGARRMSLFMDVTMAILALKTFIDNEAARQNLSAEDLISTMGKLVVTEDENDPTMSKVQLTLITNAGTEVAIGVI